MRRNVRNITRTAPRPGNRPRLLSARSVSRLGNVLRPRTFVVAAVAMLLSGGAYAFTASNTVPATTAGNGSAGISGYTVSNVSYTLSNGSSGSSGTAASPVITAVSFTLNASATGSNVSAVISAGTPGSLKAPQATYGSCGSGSGTTFTCSLSGGAAESVADATVLTVTAAQ